MPQENEIVQKLNRTLYGCQEITNIKFAVAFVYDSETRIYQFRKKSQKNRRCAGRCTEVNLEILKSIAVINDPTDSTMLARYH